MPTMPQTETKSELTSDQKSTRLSGTDPGGVCKGEGLPEPALRGPELLRAVVTTFLRVLSSTIFEPDMRLTFFARKPGDRECSLIVTDELNTDIDELLSVIRYTMENINDTQP